MKKHSKQKRREIRETEDREISLKAEKKVFQERRLTILEPEPLN